MQRAGESRGQDDPLVLADPISAHEARTYTHEGATFRPHNLVFGGNRTGGELDIATAVRAKGGTGHGDFESETSVVQNATRGKDQNGLGVGTDLSYTLDGASRHAVAINLRGREGGANPDVASLRAASGGSSRSYVQAYMPARSVGGTDGEVDSRYAPREVCDALHQGSGSGNKAPLAQAFSAKDHGAGAGDLAPTLRGMQHHKSHANAGGQIAIATSGDVGYQARDADASETDPAALLRALRDAVDEKTLSEWSVGVVASFWPQEVLQSGMHGGGVRCAPQPQRGLVNVALSRSQAGSRWSVRDLWEAGGDGCPPQGWQPSEQLAEQLGAYLSLLPYSPSPAERFLRDLRRASEGAGLLRQALSAVQAARRSACDQGQPVCAAEAGGRSEPGENVLGSGVPETISCERLLRDARAESAAGDAQPAMRIRRLVVEECEALMGMPRGYTNIRYRGKPAADGPRYRSIGNSMAIPCLRWLGERIAAVDPIPRGKP